MAISPPNTVEEEIPNTQRTKRIFSLAGPSGASSLATSPNHKFARSISNDPSKWLFKTSFKYDWNPFFQPPEIHRLQLLFE